MPSAPWALSVGMKSRACLESMIVSTATQSGLLNVEIVGLRKAGRAAETASRALRGKLNFNPPCAERLRPL